MPGGETSPTPYNNASTSSVRRNLFSTHLSQRPASSRSQPSPQSNSQPPVRLPSQPQATNASTQTNNHTFAPPLFFDGSHSPQRQSSNPFSPSHSPNHNTPTLYPSSSIIALHPVTGRPILPTIPTLPSHLRLSSADSNSEPPDPGDPDTHYDTGQHPSDKAPTATDNYWLSTEESDRADAERIEKSLVEMYYRQRQKHRHQQHDQDHYHASSSSSSHKNIASSMSQKPQSHDLGITTHGHSHSHTISSGPQFDNHETGLDEEVPEHISHFMSGDREADKMETDELMNLIMTSLRKRLTELDEERWMFEGGSHEVGVGAMGAEFEGGKGYN